MSIYGFRGSPSYRTADPEEQFAQAMDMPMSMGSTYWDQTQGGILSSLGLGTAIRDATTPMGNTSQLSALEQMKRAAGQLMNPVGAIVGNVRRLTGEATPSMSEEEYKASPYFRDAIPWDAAMTQDRAAALAGMYDIRITREHFAQKRPITSFFGNLTGQAIDPINYIPIAGPIGKAAAVSRAGVIGGNVLTSSLDAAANTALAGALTAETRSRFGDEITWQRTVSEIAMAALIGAAFGTVGGALERRAGIRADVLRQEAEQRLGTLKATQEARIALNEAIGGLVNDGEVRLGPNAVEPMSRVAREVEAVAQAYDSVRAQPTGPVRDPLVEIRPDDIEGTIVARGAFKGINEVDVSSKRGWGLVKILWRHGEEGPQDARFRVEKSDVTALPEVVREYDPSSVSNDGNLREWRVQRDGRTIVYADSLMPEGRHLVTAYVQRPDAPGAEVPLSQKRKPAALGSPDEPLKPVGDTGSQALPSPENGQSLPARTNLAQSTPVDNSTARPDPLPAGRAEAEAAVAKPETYKTIADQYRVDPETGSFAEEPELARLVQEGRVTQEDAAILDAADETYKDSAAYGEALRSVVGCLL